MVVNGRGSTKNFIIRKYKKYIWDSFIGEEEAISRLYY
jgi:hypothetical protein